MSAPLRSKIPSIGRPLHAGRLQADHELELPDLSALEIWEQYLDERRRTGSETLLERLIYAGRDMGRDLPYTMDPDTLDRIARETVAAHPLTEDQPRHERRRALFRDVIDRLADTYPGWVDREPLWALNRCGGAEFSVAMLHVSPTEYLMLIGTNVGLTGADSGTYATDVWDFVLEGENYNASADPCEPVEVTRAGEYTFLGRGQRKLWSTTGPCWMLDYARGHVLAMTHFGLAENMTVLANPRGTLVQGRQWLTKMARAQARRTFGRTP